MKFLKLTITDYRKSILEEKRFWDEQFEYVKLKTPVSSPLLEDF